MLLNTQRITEEIKEEIKKYRETSEDKNTTIQNLLDIAKAVLTGKFLTIQVISGNKKKILNKQVNLVPIWNGEKRTNKTQTK